MFPRNLGIILLSTFLIFATAPVAPAQQTTPEESSKQTGLTQKEMASKDEISKAQQALKDKGMYMGTVDGTMNAQFEKTVRDFQQKNNLRTTGTLNHETMMALGMDGHWNTAPTHKSKSVGTSSSGTHKKKGTSRGTETGTLSKERIREVQTALKDQGFAPGPIDGIKGVKTTTALRNFQSHHHMTVTGKIDDPTQAALKLQGETPSARLEKSTRYEPRQRMKPSSNLHEVMEVQQALKDLGYNPGEINGMMSSDTQRALRQFQTSNNLPVTGVIDKRTQIALGWPEKRTNPSYELSQTQKESDLSTHKDTGIVDKDASERISKATDVLQDLTSGVDKRIPAELLERAEAIVVIPNMVKGAFGIGGRYGKGVVAERLERGRWSAPAFVQVGGGSFGAQIGVSSTDLVLVFTDAKALELLSRGKDLKLGVDASIVAGPVGRSAEAGVNANLETAIYAYSRAKGLFAGVALDGAVLDLDNQMNRKVYGESVTAKQILSGSVSPNSTVRPFVDALEKVIPTKRIS